MHRIFGGARLVFWGVFPRADSGKSEKPVSEKDRAPGKNSSAIDSS